MRMTRIRKRKAKINKFKGIILNLDNLLYNVLSVIFAIGILIGIFILNLSQNDSMGQLFEFWKGFSDSNYTANFFKGFISYFKFIFGIFLCMFFKYGFLGIFLLLLIKGISIGFTSAFIIKYIGFSGISDILKFYFPQAFIMIFVCIAFGAFSIRKSIVKYTKSQKK